MAAVRRWWSHRCVVVGVTPSLPLLLAIQASHEARLRQQRLVLVREHAEKLEAKRMQAEAMSRENTAHFSSMSKAEARVHEALAEAEALRESEAHAQETIEGLRGEVRALESALEDARRAAVADRPGSAQEGGILGRSNRPSDSLDIELRPASTESTDLVGPTVSASQRSCAGTATALSTTAADSNAGGTPDIWSLEEASTSEFSSGAAHSLSLASRPESPIVNLTLLTNISAQSPIAAGPCVNSDISPDLPREISPHALGASPTGSRSTSRPWSTVHAGAQSAQAITPVPMSIPAGSKPSTGRTQVGQLIVDGVCVGTLTSEGCGLWRCETTRSVRGTSPCRSQSPVTGWGGVQRSGAGDSSWIGAPNANACSAPLCRSSDSPQISPPVGPVFAPPMPAAAMDSSATAVAALEGSFIDPDDDNLAFVVQPRPSGGVLRKRYTPNQLASARQTARELRDAATTEQAAMLAVANVVKGSSNERSHQSTVPSARCTASSTRSGVEAAVSSGHAREENGRVAYLMREGVGSSPVMGIHTAIRPALVAASPEDVKAVLSRLFVRQRQLSSQRALDNWELFALAARLRPRQELLHNMRRALEHRRDELLRKKNAPRQPQNQDGQHTSFSRPLSPNADPTSARGSVSSSTSPNWTDETYAEKMRERIDKRLACIPALLERNQRRFGFSAEIHSIRRNIYATVATRLLTRTLHALTRLTDAANTKAAFPLRKLGSAQNPAAADFDPVDIEDELAKTVFSRGYGWPDTRDTGAAQEPKASKRCASVNVLCLGSAGAPLSIAPSQPLEQFFSSASWEAAHLAAQAMTSRAGISSKQSHFSSRSGSSSRLQSPAPLHPPNLLAPASARRHRSPPREGGSKLSTHSGGGRMSCSSDPRPATANSYIPPTSSGWAKSACVTSLDSAKVGGNASTPRSILFNGQHEISVRTTRRGKSAQVSSNPSTTTSSSTNIQTSIQPIAPTPSSRKGVADAIAFSAAIRSDALRRGPGQLLSPAPIS